MEAYYLVDGSAISENEINGTFNVAFFEVMPTSIITKCILCTVESTAGEVRFVA